MKQHRVIAVLAAALVGVTAAAFPSALPELPGIVAEAATTADGLVYTVQNGAVTITGYTGTAAAVTIPSYIGGKPVRKIGERAFCEVVGDNGHYSYQGLPITSVSIPNTVYTIDSYAFYNCPLKTVTLPASVTEIGQGAFQKCLELTSATVQGPAQIGSNAFTRCTKLKNIRLHANCRKAAGAVKIFTNCTALTNLNGLTVVRSTPDENNIPKPVLAVSAAGKVLIKEFFSDCLGVKFVDTYCTALCQYIADTETRPWMSDALKARQIHNWLVRHCVGEDEEGDIMKDDNHRYSSVFLSYGTDERGPGVGETVCEGFSKAYTMILKKAGIESYVLSAAHTPYAEQGHAWTLLKINNKYYQTDVTWDVPGSQGSTVSYQHFLKSNAQMETLHSNQYGAMFYAPTVSECKTDSQLEHPLLSCNIQTGQAALGQCIHNFNDTNGDGLLDGDWNFDGVKNGTDYLYYRKICAVCNVNSMTIDSQPDFLNNLLLCNMSPEYWYSIA